MGFIDKVTINGNDITWKKLSRLYPEHFAHIDDYLGDNLGQGYGVISEIRALLFNCFFGSFASNEGQFSAIKTLKEGGKRIFLLYDYANNSEGSIKIFSTILNLLLKHSVDEDNNRRTYFFLDEASLLPKTCLVDAMSLGRGAGFRLVMCIQSAELMARHYSKQEAATLLSLFPNIISLKVNDSFSRSILADRYGKALYSYNFYDSMQKPVHHAEFRPVVADSDYAKIIRKGDAICSIPNLSESPFFYHGYKEGV